MKKKARSYSVDFKQEAVRRMAQATTIIGLAKELGIRRKLLYQWREQFRTGSMAGLERRRGRPPGSKSQTVSSPTPEAAELRIAELERLLGRMTKCVDTIPIADEMRRHDTYCGNFSCMPVTLAAGLRPGARRTMGLPSNRSRPATNSAVPSGRPLPSASRRSSKS
jgi:transposase-like protein